MLHEHTMVAVAPFALCSLLGHGAGLQEVLLVWLEGPAQSAPLFAGAGLLQNLSCFKKPSPQVTLHVVSCQADQPPSTSAKERIIESGAKDILFCLSLTCWVAVCSTWARGSGSIAAGRGHDQGTATA